MHSFMMAMWRSVSSFLFRNFCSPLVLIVCFFVLLNLFASNNIIVGFASDVGSNESQKKSSMMDKDILNTISSGTRGSNEFHSIIQSRITTSTSLSKSSSQPRSLTETLAPFTFISSPTTSPSMSPSVSPSQDPTVAPSMQPSYHPTSSPADNPTKRPTANPSTRSPTNNPTRNPTRRPSKKPTRAPSKRPTKLPSKVPTVNPTSNPTNAPTVRPTKDPIRVPTKNPTTSPSMRPTIPTKKPTSLPTKRPTNPTNKPSNTPTTQSPTRSPTKPMPTTSPSLSPTQNPTKFQPNIVFMLVDDVGYGDIRANGNNIIRTPYIDSIKATWTRLENFHVDPTCSPSRAAFMTGRYPLRVGVWHTVMSRNIIRSDETLLPQVLKSNGYYTALIGKWHLGDNYPYRPTDRGFDYYFGLKAGGGIAQTPDFWNNNNFNTAFMRGENEVVSTTGFCTDILFDEAIKVIREAPRPFFLYLPLNAAHVPNSAPKEDTQYYTAYTFAGFYGMITNIDRNIERFDRVLENEGLKNDTIVILTSDNGSACGPSRCKNNGGGMAGFKSSVLEGGHRVMFYMRWPREDIQGRVINKLLGHIDLFPTLLELSGSYYTPKEGYEFDGISFAPLLRGDNMPDFDDRIFVVDDQRRLNPREWSSAAVLMKNWRLTKKGMLYDISIDPLQKTNIGKFNKDIVTLLGSYYHNWYQSVSARIKETPEFIVGNDKTQEVNLNSMDIVTRGGMPPWDQSMVLLETGGRGYWPLNIVEGGLYTIEARHFPEEANMKINFVAIYVRAEMIIGGRTYTVGIGSISQVVKFDNINIQAGSTTLQVSFYSSFGKVINAHYVKIKKIQMS